MFSSTFKNVTAPGTAKSTVDSLRRPMFMSFPVIVPPLSDQIGIADFLDGEIAKIDRLTTKQNELVSALHEYLRATTMRLTMEPGRGWHRTRVGLALKKLTRLPSETDPVVTAFRDGQMTSRESRREDGYTVSFTEKDYQGVRAGDLVFHALDGFAGAVGVADSDGKSTPVYHVCSARPGYDAEYLANHIRVLGQTGLLTAHAWSVRQRSVDYRNWSLFASLPVELPPYDEQREIIARLKQRRATIGDLVAQVQRLVDTMKERRSALISAAVTGQIDVATYGIDDAATSVSGE